VRSFIGALDGSSGSGAPDSHITWRPVTHDFHEVTFMIVAFSPGQVPWKMGSRWCPLPPWFSQLPGAEQMKWVTPQAVDFRFGMEITMYIANR
jgi:coenzyme PQQ precursor peptide PqqA